MEFVCLRVSVTLTYHSVSDTDKQTHCDENNITKSRHLQPKQHRPAGCLGYSDCVSQLCVVVCRSEEKCQALTLQIRNAPREEEVERFETIATVVVVIRPRDLITLSPGAELLASATSVF